jgi:hypothetical protein
MTLYLIHTFCRRPLKDIVHADFLKTTKQRASDSVMPGASYKKRVSAVMSYLSQITGKSVNTILNEEVSIDQVIGKFTTSLQTLFKDSIPSDEPMIQRLLKLFEEYSSQDSVREQLMQDHFVKRVWVDANPISSFTTTAPSISTSDGKHKNLQMKMVLKPNQVRLDLVDETGDTKVVFAADILDDAGSLGEISKYQGPFEQI